MYGTGTTLTQSATKARAMEPQLISQEIEQRHDGIINVCDDIFAVNIELICRHAVSSPVAARIEQRANAARRGSPQPLYLGLAPRAHRMNCQLEGFDARRPASSFEAKACAVVSASAAGTFTSGSTPTPSQLVLVVGLIARANGTPIVNRSSMRWPATGCAPPPVTSPTIVARFSTLRLLENSSPPENVRCDVST